MEGRLGLFAQVGGIMDSTQPAQTVKVPDRKGNGTPRGIQRIALIGVFAALCYVGFQFLRIDISLPGGKTAFHMGNVFLLVAALLLGPLSGAMAGSIGMTIADLTSGYAMYAPTTFLLKFCIGLITGSVAHRAGRIYAIHDKKLALRWSILGSSAGILFNIFADPLVGYFYQRYLLNLPVEPAKFLAKIAAGTTAVNGIVTVALSAAIYLAIMPLRKTWQRK